MLINNEQFLLIFKNIFLNTLLKLNFETHKRIVNFAICGSQRCGTSGLYYYLNLHPKISMGIGKNGSDEPKFFDNDHLFKPFGINFKITDFDIYHKFFQNIKKNNLIGTNGPIYTFWDNSLLRLWHYNKDIKIIIILRNPILRSFSHWNKNVNAGLENKNFYDSLLFELEKNKNFRSKNRNFSYLHRSLYSTQIKQAFNIFNKKNIFFLKTENLIKNPIKEMNQIYEFLNLQKLDKLQSRVSNPENYYNRRIDKKSLLLIKSILKDDIIETGKLLNWNIEDWLQY